MKFSLLYTTGYHNILYTFTLIKKLFFVSLLVAFGTMFSQQIADDAKENYQLLLNIIHWLDQKFD